MCRHCVRVGTTLISLPWPSKPVVIEAMPPMSADLRELLDLYHEGQAAMRDAIFAAQRCVPANAETMSYSGAMSTLKQFEKSRGYR